MENKAFAATDKKEMCQQHMHRYVLVQTADGMCFDGIVEHVDDEVLCIAVPFGQGEGDPRAFIPFGGYPYGYGYYPRRRFYRQTFPLAGLLALSLLPYYF
ncbi:hypothetical protein A7K91_23650 [Paenibacillus oryzae]|uniref:Phosphatidylinositol kinase n=1 Tax=Paenibacillus oryzae TaxID=1844972 RepID=A0A1A5YBX9_9BACL|nr:hypothetical protein [Paenibacillus oryzae]OBR63101.1 hypothetical protein A7K91_23650 [Paenibacillus oryzae]